jgi:hypothetical protein
LWGGIKETVYVNKNKILCKNCKSVFKVKRPTFHDKGSVINEGIFSRAARPAWNLEVSTPSIFYEIR